MKFILNLIVFALFTASSFAAELDVLEDKPIKQLYFRYTEGSLKNMEQDKWIKRWSKLDGIVLKAWNEEVTGFNAKTKTTLAAYKSAYPKKALLLHFNGRGVLPEFGAKYASAIDYLYFLGTDATSDLSDEATSTLKVKNVDAFSLHRRKKNHNAAKEDVVIVKKRLDGSLDWDVTEHAKLLSINSDGTITLQRDLLGTGKVTLKANQAYIAQHVARGPFGKEKQRLWEYNWFKFDHSPHNIFHALPTFLAEELTTDYKFFDGIEFDVLTETHRTMRFGYPMLIDADANGHKDDFSTEAYNDAHRSGIYAFLANLRTFLPSNKLILADGDFQHQKATWLLNGIESERWPARRDTELKQWSDGINRHMFWNEFAQAPKLSYFKVAEFFAPGRVPIDMPANIRRLIVAAGVLTDSAIIPAFKPNGVPFHRWPEFRKLKNLGEPKSGLITLTEKPLKTAAYEKANGKKEKAILFESPLLNNGDPDFPPSHCLILPEGVEALTVKLTAALKSEKSHSYPSTFYIGNNETLQRAFVAEKPFTAWFSWEKLNDKPLCFALSEPKHQLKVEEIALTESLKAEAKVFEKGILIANNNNSLLKLDSKALAPLEQHVDINKLLRNKSHLIVPAKDMMIIRYKKEAQ